MDIICEHGEAETITTTPKEGGPSVTFCNACAWERELAAREEKAARAAAKMEERQR